MTDAKKELPSYYAILTADVRYDERLKPNEKLLYAEITALTNFRGYCNASNSYFSKLYKVHKNTVGNWVNRLVELGYIKSEIVMNDNKQIVSRKLYLVNPINKISDTPINEKIDTPQQKDCDPINEIIEGNNTRENITSKNSKEAKASSSSSDDPQSTTAEMSFADQCKIIIEKWNSVAPLPIKLITPNTNRAKQLKARIKTYSIDGVLEAIDLVASSQFLQGDNKQNWVITFDWFVKPSNFQKVFEGNYTRERVARNEISNRSNQRTETKMERARRVQREIIEQLERFPDQTTSKDVVFHD